MTIPLKRENQYFFQWQTFKHARFTRTMAAALTLFIAYRPPFPIVTHWKKVPNTSLTVA